MAGHIKFQSTKSSCDKVTVVVGALDEISNIGSFLDQVINTLTDRYEFEIVVVDDHSVDGTREYLVHRSKSDSRIVPVFNCERKGLLHSHLQGIAIARGEYVVVMDCDLQHPAEKIVNIIGELQSGSDIVVCSRYVAGGSPGRRSPLRGLISRIAAMLGRIALNGNSSTRDSVSGFFGFTSHLTLPPPAYHFSFKTLLYVMAQNPGAKITEIPFTFRNRASGESKIVNSWKFIPSYLVEIINIDRTAYHARRDHRLDTQPVISNFTDYPLIEEK